MVFFVAVCSFWTMFIWVRFSVVTCVSVIDGSINGSDAEFDAMNCLLLISFDVFWAVSVSIMVVFFVSRMISLSDSVWSSFSTCVLFLSSICVLFFDVSAGVMIYFLSLFISVCVFDIPLNFFFLVLFSLRSWYLLCWSFFV